MTKQDRIDMEHEAEAYAEKYKTASPQEQSLIALAYLDGLKDGLNKANEWHFVKDGDYPKDDKPVLSFDKE